MRTFSCKVVSGVFLVLIITKLINADSCKVFSFSDEFSDSLAGDTLYRNSTFNLEDGSFEFLHLNNTNKIKISGAITELDGEKFLELRGNVELPVFRKYFSTGKDRVFYFGGFHGHGHVHIKLASSVLG
ncbi:unnamed protein product [Hermetia illucens]|uniref:Uncharacterized protein n=2 Tax=Hermetia illucens TaxID=343691 RepID=A0A7R8YUG3_HERIL|nr:unnamed protein product [Hermetia illucens]